MKPALLVIDMQEAFFDFSPAVSESLTLAVEYINGAIELFRGKDLPIFCIEDLEEEAGRIPGSKGFETTSKIDLLPTDPRIHKTYGNAFIKTDLHEQLQKLAVDTLILRSSLADTHLDRIRFVEEIHDLISCGALVKFMELL